MVWCYTKCPGTYGLNPDVQATDALGPSHVAQIPQPPHQVLLVLGPPLPLDGPL